MPDRTFRGVHLPPNFSDRPEGAPILAQRVATAAQDGVPRQPPLGFEQFAADSGFTRAVERRRPLHRTFPPGEPPAGVLLEDAANPLLGVLLDEPYDSATEPPPPGATLLLYTDGLVERPGEHLDTGLNRLRERPPPSRAGPCTASATPSRTARPPPGPTTSP